MRDAALLAPRYGAGLRRAKAVRLDVDHFDAKSGALRVYGEGAKAHQAYLHGAAADVLRGWLAARGDPPVRLRLPVSARGEIVYMRQPAGCLPAPGGLTEYALYLRLRKRTEEAAVRPFTPDDCFRTVAGDLHDAGADSGTVRRLLGNASVTTTARYDRRGERTKRDTVDLLSLPAVGFRNS